MSTLDPESSCCSATRCTAYCFVVAEVVVVVVVVTAAVVADTSTTLSNASQSSSLPGPFVRLPSVIEDDDTNAIDEIKTIQSQTQISPNQSQSMNSVTSSSNLLLCYLV